RVTPDGWFLPPGAQSGEKIEQARELRRKRCRGAALDGSGQMAVGRLPLPRAAGEEERGGQNEFGNQGVVTARAFAGNTVCPRLALHFPQQFARAECEPLPPFRCPLKHGAQ